MKTGASLPMVLLSSQIRTMAPGQRFAHILYADLATEFASLFRNLYRSIRKLGKIRTASSVEFWPAARRLFEETLFCIGVFRGIAMAFILPDRAQA